MIVTEGVDEGVTLMTSDAENAEAHPGLCTTALKCVVLVRLPIAALVNVLLVFKISVGTSKSEVEAFCHFKIFPVLPLNVRSAGVLPAQMV